MNIPAPNQSHLPPSFFSADELTWPSVLACVGHGWELPAPQMNWAMDQIMSGLATDGQIAAFAFGMQVKGITTVELTAAAAAMRRHALKLDLPNMQQAVDIVGTGGDGHHTVNISTMSAFVVAGAGAQVVKHGNRAASSKSGGADLLEALGVDIERDPEGLAHDLAASNFGFLFARTYHPAMRFAGPVRSEIKIPTLFNLLGPLTNPAMPGCGLIGCAFEDKLSTMAGAFAAQGSRVCVVRGHDAMDEITISGPTNVIAVSRTGAMTYLTITPELFGFSRTGLESLRGDDAAYNAGIAKALLNNELVDSPIEQAVLMNAAVALATVHGWDEEDPSQEAVTQAFVQQLDAARDALRSGAALQALERLLSAQQSSH